MKQEEFSHTPVLKNEVIQALQPSEGKFFIDCTFGAGGHTKAMLEAGAKVVAVDRDENNKKFAIELQKIYGDNLVFINDKFSNLDVILQKYNFNIQNSNHLKLDGILYDFGVSSMQIDDAGRGFSFQKDGDLDMRMGCNTLSAKDVVNKTKETELADIIYRYGGERFSRKIAHTICQKRIKKPITSTLELAEIVKQCIPFYHDNIHPATRTFQAIRILVNDELSEIEKTLKIASTLTPIGCKIACITFHSLEDKIVKNMFQKYSNSNTQHFNRNNLKILDLKPNLSSITLKVNTKKPITPNEEELKNNIRSRSAKLRIAERF